MKLHSNEVFEVFQLIGTKLSEMPLKWAEKIEWLWCEFLRPKTNDCWTKLHYSKLYVISFSPKSALATSLHTFHTQLQCNDVDEKFTLKYSFWASSLYFQLPTSFVHFSRRISSEKRCSTYCIIRQSLTQERKWRRTKVSRNDSHHQAIESTFQECVSTFQCVNSTISSSHTIWFNSLSKLWFCNIIKWNAIMVTGKHNKMWILSNCVYCGDLIQNAFAKKPHDQNRA